MHELLTLLYNKWYTAGIYQWRLSRVYCDCKTSCGLIQDAMVYSAAGVRFCFWSWAAWPPTSCTWPFPLYILVLYGELIPSSLLNWISRPSLLRRTPSYVFEINKHNMYVRYKKFRSSGIFAHPAGSSDLVSSWASRAFRIANLWRIHGEAGWKICFGQIKGRK